ncbi:MAG: hypothetical protein EON54_16145 [Alcaligenaceae bacterium]|nr:MAG: hypothetical protein EON54_16145 [Alcaligenaceae bacterium]
MPGCSARTNYSPVICYRGKSSTTTIDVRDERWLIQLHGSIANLGDVHPTSLRYGCVERFIMGHRTFTLAGQRVDIVLEEPFWECLEDLADDQYLSLGALVEMIGRKSELDLTIALRLYVFEDVLQKAGCTLTATPAPCKPSLKYH